MVYSEFMVRYLVVFTMLIGVFVFLLASVTVTDDFYGCYETMLKQVVSDEKTAGTQHWRDKKVCSVRKEVFDSLGACQQEQFGSWYKVMPLFEKIVGTLEPKAQEVEDVRKAHAETCIDYPSTLLE